MRKNASLMAAAAVALGAAVLLAACGGGDNDVVPVATPVAPRANEQVPASASASTSGFIAYLQALLTLNSDTLEPVDVSAVVAPTSETESPVVVD